MPHVAERMNAFVVQTFLKIYTQEYSQKVPAKDSSITSRTKLVTFLELFSKFKNPKVIQSSVTVYEVFLDLLSKSDSKVQSLAVDCIATWKMSTFNKYQEVLKALIDDKNFREELTKLTMGESIPDEEKDSLMPFVIRILLGNMMKRKGKISNSSRRVAILTFLSTLPQNYLLFFLELITKPLKDIGSEEYLTNTTVCLGFLNLLKDVVHQLGNNISPYVSTVMDPLLYIAHKSHIQLQVLSISSEEEKENEETPPGKEINK